MTAGALLVAEGLFGAVRDLIPGRRNNKRSSGLFGNLFVMFFGVIFIATSLWVKPATYPDDIQTRGTIAAVESSRAKKNRKVTYQPTYSFQVDGKEYRFSPSIRTSKRPVIGESVGIAYSKSDPGKARRTDGVESKMHWLFGGAGAFIFLSGLVRVLLSLAMISFGVWLFLSGRKDRKSSGAGSGGFLSDLMSLVRDSRSPV